jgi:hypothetical protein
MSWSPPPKYKGLRTSYKHAAKVLIPCDVTKFRDRLVHNAKYADMIDWCEENCTRNWSSFSYTEWYFDKTNEAVMFKMIFGGR